MPASLLLWPVGQAVKTAASHAVNVGSIPARDVLSKAECIRKISNMISAFLFFSEGKWNGISANTERILLAAV